LVSKQKQNWKNISTAFASSLFIACGATSGRTDFQEEQAFRKSTKTKELHRFASLSSTLRRLPDAADKFGFAAGRTSSAFASLPPLG
jgi:hypothetical protein